jgi:hypothetical protein
MPGKRGVFALALALVAASSAGAQVTGGVLLVTQAGLV